MPELPEVETTLQGIKPHLQGQTVKRITVRHHGLRWPVPKNLNTLLKQKKILALHRRAKYLLITFQSGTLIIHLGMSGSLRILQAPMPPKKHDHVDIEINNGVILRYTDPRRFGAILWGNQNPLTHALLRALGPEPFDRAFCSDYLVKQAHNKKIAVKPFIMDSKIVVGVGNIYATEALFDAGIHPTLPANTVSPEEYKRLTTSIKKILRAAVKAGGTTLKDFSKSDGKPGYFKQKLKAYGRAGLPCIRCGHTLESAVIGQRNTVFCSVCQTLHGIRTKEHTQ